MVHCRETSHALYAVIKLRDRQLQVALAAYAPRRRNVTCEYTSELLLLGRVLRLR